MMCSHWSTHASLPGSCKNCPINSDDCALKKIRGRRGEKNCGVTKCLKALSLSKRPIEINKRYTIVMTLLSFWSKARLGKVGHLLEASRLEYLAQHI